MRLRGTSTASQVFAITGYTSLTVECDWFSDSNLDSGEYVYADWRIDGGTWNDWFTGLTGGPGSDTWYCDDQLVNPGTGDTLEIRFGINASNTNEDMRVDNFLLTGSSPGCDWQDDVLVEFWDQTTWQTLKAAGAVDGSPYDILGLGYYNGIGTYQVRITESADGTATLSNGVLHVEAVGECDLANCGTAPEVSDDSAHHMKLTKNGDNVDLLYEDVAATGGYNLYVSKNPETLVANKFDVSDPVNMGRVDCTIPDSPDAGGMRLSSDYDADGALTNWTVLYFLVSADNGGGTEGPLGSNTVEGAREATAYCAK